MKNPDDNKTIDLFDDPVHRLRDEWAETISGEGGHCPVCDKFGKVYKYKLSQALALALKWIAEHGDEEGWVDVQQRGPRWMLRSKTYPLLTHWGFLESKGSRSGVWRPTPHGLAFIEGTLLAPSAVYVYDNSKWGSDSESIAFRGCFGVKFDFDALMSDQFKWADLASLEKSDADD